MNKLKIAFEITDNWVREEFRNLITTMKRTPGFFYPNLEIELYIITTNQDTIYVNRVASNLGLDPNHVFSFNNVDNKIDKLEELKINIYLTNLQLEYIKVDQTEIHPILVNNIYDRYDNAYKYLLKLDTIIHTILDGENKTKC